MSPKQRRPGTLLHDAFIALALVVAPACAAQPHQGQSAKPATKPAPATAVQPAGTTPPPQQPAPAQAAEPQQKIDQPSAQNAKLPPQMAGFDRFVGGEWKVTFTSGDIAYHAWRFGPGKFSLHKMSDAANGYGKWAGEIMYWHPGRKHVVVLGMHEDIPGVGRGVGEGPIAFQGESAEGVFDLYQPRGLRKMGTRIAFDGPDKYREILLEDTGAGLQPMNQWDFVRIEKRPPALPRAAEAAPIKLSETWKPFEPLLGHIWQTLGQSEVKPPGAAAAGSALHVQTTIQWLPTLEVIYARIMAPNTDAPPTHLFDAYIYQHVKTEALHCLALSANGSVYEGTASVLDGGALQLELTGYDGDRAVPHEMRFDFESDGTLRLRTWAGNGGERSLIFESNHKEVK